MALSDVTVDSYEINGQRTFGIQVEGDQCYGEDCTGCCGIARTNLSRAEMESLRRAVTDALRTSG